MSITEMTPDLRRRLHPAWRWCDVNPIVRRWSFVAPVGRQLPLVAEVAAAASGDHTLHTLALSIAPDDDRRLTQNGRPVPLADFEAARAILVAAPEALLRDDAWAYAWAAVLRGQFNNRVWVQELEGRLSPPALAAWGRAVTAARL